MSAIVDRKGKILSKCYRRVWRRARTRLAVEYVGVRHVRCQVDTSRMYKLVLMDLELLQDTRDSPAKNYLDGTHPWTKWDSSQQCD